MKSLLAISALFLCLTTSAEESKGLFSFEFVKGKEVLDKFGQPSLNELPRRSKILVWNIYKGRKEDFVEKFIENTEGAHLILLQEFNENVKASQLSESDKKLQYNYAATAKYKGVKKAGVSTASPVKSLHESYQHSDGVMGIIPPKTSLFTTYKITGTNKKLLVINIHAKNAAFLETYQAQINRVYDRIVRHHGPVLFAGDFNSWSTDRYEYIKKILARADMKMIKFDQDNRMKAPVVSKLFDYFDYPLDNIFYKGFEIQNAKSLPTDTGSDHGAMTFDMVFSNRSLEGLKDMRPGGSGDTGETTRITLDLMQQLSEMYDISTLDVPSVVQVRNSKRIDPILTGSFLNAFVNDSVYLHAKWVGLNFLTSNKLPVKLHQCIWGMDIEGETLFIRLMKELLKVRVIDEMKFIQIISKHADTIVGCR